MCTSNFKQKCKGLLMKDMNVNLCYFFPEVGMSWAAIDNELVLKNM